MTRTYEYNGFSLQVAVESDCRNRPAKRASAHPGYVAVVRICEAGSAVPRLSQLRLGEAGGHPFDSEADALNGGYIAARTIVDDLFGQDIANSIVMPLWQSPVTLPSPGVLLSFSERAKRPEKVPPVGCDSGAPDPESDPFQRNRLWFYECARKPRHHPRASHHR